MTAADQRVIPVPDPARIRWGGDGLVPAVVVDVADGAVLMLAWMDAEAFGATVATGDVHFHSRSRGTLWRKGETSGNVLRLRSIALDCDGDALLVTAEPHGPTCHTGARTCFAPPDGPGSAASTATAATAAGEPGAPQGFAWLETLWATIEQRATVRPSDSYTATLLAKGVDAVARKVTEEATEVLLAAKDDAVAEGGAAGAREATGAALAGEAADLLFHLLVLLRERSLPPGRVIGELRRRHGG